MLITLQTILLLVSVTIENFKTLKKTVNNDIHKKIKI